MKVTCDYCGKEFDKQPAEIKRTGRNFCNHACRGQFERARHAVRCTQCGKKLIRRLYEIKRTKTPFCSLACLGQFRKENRREKVRCDQCGKELERRFSESKTAEHHFCNKKCYGAWIATHRVGEDHPNWQGGYEPYYGPNWSEQRDRARRRDRFMCRACGISEKQLGRELDIHHIIPFRQFGTEDYETANSLANLICLCPSHHSQLERLEPEEQIRQITHRGTGRTRSQ